MPWYELAIAFAGVSGGCFVPGLYAKLKKALVDWANG
jgi:hypothetical protein